MLEKKIHVNHKIVRHTVTTMRTALISLLMPLRTATFILAVRKREQLVILEKLVQLKKMKSTSQTMPLFALECPRKITVTAKVIVVKIRRSALVLLLKLVAQQRWVYFRFLMQAKKPHSDLKWWLEDWH